jgi:fructokinase
MIFFEPSSIKDEKGFKECLDVSDIVKFSDDRIPNYSSTFPKGQVSFEIQTMGDKGLKYRRKNSSNWKELKGFSIDNVIDTAGAGDWCTAGIICDFFSNNYSLKTISDIQFENSLKFGQILSAINCIFEGARGIMYNMPYEELIRKVENVISTKANNISLLDLPSSGQFIPAKAIKISTLFQHA